MGQSTQIMGSSFRRGLHSEVVTFLTRLAIQPLPLYQSNGEKRKTAASCFCILSSDSLKQLGLLLYSRSALCLNTQLYTRVYLPTGFSLLSKAY